jgi:hypothetical protein
MLMSYNSPRYNGDVAKTIAEREELSEKLSKQLESSLDEYNALFSNNNTGGGGGGGSSDLLNDKESGMREVVEKEGLKQLSWFNKLWNLGKTPSSSLLSGSASRTNDATNDIESGGSSSKEGSTTTAAVDRTLAGSAGVLRMQRYFMVLLPPNTPHVVVSLQPAKPLPWKWIGLGTVVSVTAVIVVLKARRSK